MYWRFLEKHYFIVCKLAASAMDPVVHNWQILTMALLQAGHKVEFLRLELTYIRSHKVCK